METEQSILFGRSKCPKCQKVLGFLELVPVVSYLLQRGICRGCRSRIPLQYLFVELSVGVLFALVAVMREPLSPIFFRDLVFLSALSTIFVFDFKHSLIPDKVVIPALVIALLWNLNFGMWNLVLAVSFGAGFFLIQYLVSKGRWIGEGDIRVGAMMGAMLGWPLIGIALLISYIIGGAFGVVLIVLRKARMKTQIPFGTFLTVGTAITLFWGSNILGWYLSRIGL